MIDQMKNFGLSPNEISNHDFEFQTKGKLSLIYDFYQNRLKDYNSVDFGDLILLPLKILKEKNEILDVYKNKNKIYFS